MHRGPMGHVPGERPVLSGPAPLRRVVGLFGPYRGQVSVVVVLILITSALGVINPLLIQQVFDRGLFTPDGVHMQTLAILVGIMAAVPVISGLIAIGQVYMTNSIGQRVMADLRDALYRHLQRMSLRFFTGTRTGEIQSRLTNDVGGVQSVVSETASSILSNIVILISTIIAMLVISWQLTVLSLGLIPVFVYLTYRVGKARRTVALETQKSKAEMSAITQETLSVSGILLAKVFGRQREEVERFREENRRLATLSIRQSMIGQVFFATIQIFFSITPALVYLVAGFTIRGGGAGHITGGGIVAFTTLQSRLFFPVGQMLQISVEVQSSLALFQRIFEYLDLDVDIEDRPDAVELDLTEVRGEVRLDDVWFRYREEAAGVLVADTGEPAKRDGNPSGDARPPGTASPPGADAATRGLAAAALEEARSERREWALEGVSFDVRPGQLAAIVGPSGAGKTTISYLLPRLYDVDRGAVLIDGRDVRTLGQRSLAGAVGMVTQESYLFHASVRRNLMYARPGATDEEMQDAARAAFIHDRVMEMRQGYDTVVGERGYRLSGGEKQRIAIARVILKDPRVLILDEATSALDTRSERLVQAALKPLMHGRTTIAIAHRLSTILAADVIFVLDRGRVVERGTHTELVERDGLYARLYLEQFGGGTIESRCSDGVVMTAGAVAAGH